MEKYPHSGIARRKILWKGTTILGSLNINGILVSGDSLSWKYNSKQANQKHELKVHRLGGYPGYILLAISGSNFMTDHVLVLLRNLVNEMHKMGKVLTSKECAKQIYDFLNTDLNTLESKDYDMPPNVDFNKFECGVLVAMFEPDMKSVCADRRPGLYMASQEDWNKVDRFEIDGAGYNQAWEVMDSDYDFHKAMEDAIVEVEEAMLAASTEGNSGGIITTYRIDPNNLIEEVSRKSIAQLQKESDERKDAAGVP